MNERAVPPPLPAKPGSRTPPEISGRDREFLPAALEILETPPPPLPTAFMLTICAFAAVALIWSCVGSLDVHAVAPGKIETAGRAKVIQPLDPGKIAAIHVANGSKVTEGDLLLELDPTEAIADEEAQRDTVDATLAEVARRRFAIETARAAQRAVAASLEHPSVGAAPLESILFNPDRKIAWDDSLPEHFRLREQAVLNADLMQLADTLKNIDRQMAQREATRERLNMSISVEESLIKTLMERVNTREESLDLKVGTKINLYDAKEALQKSQSTLASDKGQLIEVDATLKELQSEKIKAISQFVADNENKLAEASRKADEARQALAKAGARLERTKLYAPIDGVVQRIAVTTIGQVVTTGQQLVVITPSDGPLQIEALVANLDIGFVKVGQEATIKVDAFPFTRYGVVHGKVTRIASEAEVEPEAKLALANATVPANGAPATPASAPGQPESFVFPVTIALDEGAMRVDANRIALTPGMTVSVEIKTGSRRVIDYLLSPLAKLASEAMKEQ